MARISLLDQDPERIELLAELSYLATPRPEIAKAMGVSPDTITNWRKDERVQKKITQLMRERANRIRAHTDTRIEQMLREGKDLSTDQLLRIRNEFTADLPAELPSDGASVLAELMEAASKDPLLARALAKALPSGDTDE